MPLPPVPNEIQKLVGPYIRRATELAPYQPLMAYFCELYSAQLILEGQYHTSSPEVAQFTEALLNDIESLKKQLTESDKIAAVISDNGKSYKFVLGFAGMIFKKAEDQVQSHTMTKQTAQDFRAAIDFYQLLNLWEPLYSADKPAIEKQIKYAKFQCALILKAYKNGEDPNDYTTAEEEKELEKLEGFEDAEEAVSTPKASSPTSPSLPKPPSDVPTLPPKPSLSSTAPADIDLPQAPKKIDGELDMPAAPVLIKGEKNSLGLPSTPSDPEPAKPKPTKPSVAAEKPAPTSRRTSTARRPSKVEKPMSSEDVNQIWRQEETIAEAQKQARFAISALNYEDVSTAITELEKALDLLNHLKV